MKSLVKKCVLLVFVFILTITCSNGRITENTISTGITINRNSESSISVNDDSNSVNNKSGISVRNDSSNDNEITIDSNNTINNETSTENIMSICNNSNTVDNETIIDSNTTKDPGKYTDNYFAFSYKMHLNSQARRFSSFP